MGAFTINSNPLLTDSFRAKFVTTGNNELVTLPLEAAGTYSATVDWGDGSPLEPVDFANRTHVYSVPGTYKVQIFGTCEGWSFEGGNGDALKIVEVENWGTAFKLGNTGGYFRGCANLEITATDTLDLTGTTNFAFMFYLCSSLTFNNSIDTWNVSNVTDMKSMFEGATLFNQPLNSWSVLNVSNMNSMFRQASSFNQSLSSWNTSTVVNMSAMFSLAIAFNGDITTWDVSNVTTMASMFAQTLAFNQDISSWDTGSVTSMHSMFFGATGFNQDISAWDFANVTSLISFMNSKTHLDYSTANYDALLIAWDSGIVNSGLSVDMGTIKYTVAASAARANLISTDSWSITDGGL